MGVLRKGILGGFSGKTGSVVGVRYRNNDIIRSHPEWIKKKRRSPRVKRHCDRFGAAARFVSNARSLARIGFVENRASRNFLNDGIAANLSNIKVVDGQIEMDFPQLKLSQGKLPIIDRFRVEEQSTERLLLVWDRNDNFNIDGEACMIHLLVYRDDMCYLKCYRSKVKASDLRFELSLTDDMQGHKLHLYAFYSLPDAQTNDHISATSYTHCSAIP
ncbi:DUF6266 family protein [Halosquirtibacter xylanolyticus]|uniref:DUF6266 family protein n=1 Tax=Halosquirtibacter xylanolyticus TaxID=3374599 RepID=UPI0037495FBA|nr:DUF6266 family protein [Prolixibacteraceae bacterium]